MTYQIQSKKVKHSPKKSFEQRKEQYEINKTLFKERTPKDVNPKLLTIIILKEKEHHFNFLKNETEFDVVGRWHNTKGKIYQEENTEINVIFYDDHYHTKSDKLMKELNSYNKKNVKEELLFVTVTPLDETSIK